MVYKSQPQIQQKYQRYLHPVAYRFQLTSDYWVLVYPPNPVEKEPAWKINSDLPVISQSLKFLKKRNFNTLEDMFGYIDKKWGGVDKIEYNANLWRRMIEERVKEIGWGNEDNEANAELSHIRLVKNKEHVIVRYWGRDEITIDWCGESKRGTYILKGEPDKILDALVETLEEIEGR